MKDYAELANRLQKGLAKAWRASDSVLGRPGSSIAVKLDPNYYLAVMPSFINHLARWGGMLPRTALDALRRTGNLAAGPDGHISLGLTVVYGSPPRSTRLEAALVPAAFVDDALRLYGGAASSPAPSDLALPASERPALETFLAGKTLLSKTAYAQA